MSMTREAQRFHAAYDEAPQAFKNVIDTAYQAARQVMHAHGWPMSNTDAAEEFVAAIMKYAVSSKDEQNDYDKANQKHAAMMLES